MVGPQIHLHFHDESHQWECRSMHLFWCQGGILTENPVVGRLQSYFARMRFLKIGFCGVVRVCQIIINARPRLFVIFGKYIAGRDIGNVQWNFFSFDTRLWAFPELILILISAIMLCVYLTC